MILFLRISTTFKCTNHLYCIRGLSSSNHVNNVRPYMETGLRKALLQVSLFCLSPPHRPLCVVGRLGRKKKRARGAWWKEEREEEREVPAFSLFPWFPARFLFFRLLLFLLGCLAGVSAEEAAVLQWTWWEAENQVSILPISAFSLAKFWTNVILASHAGVFRGARFSSLPTEEMKKELP